MTRTVRSRIATSFIACALAAGSVFGVAQAADNPPTAQTLTTATHLVISALQTAGCSANSCTTQSAGEFVELYNPTSETLQVSHWKVRYLSASGNVSSPPNLVELNGSIAPKNYILIGHANLALPNADLLFTLSTPTSAGRLAAGSGHVEILDNTGAMVDRVGWGNDAVLALGTRAAVPDTGEQLQRTSNSAGVLIDTRNNSQDFQVSPSPYVPQGGGYTPAPPEVPEDDTEDTVDPPAETSETNAACEGIIISEILPNPAGSDTGLEYIELHNPTNTAISLTGCSLQLSGSSKAYALGAVTIPPDGYLTLGDTTTGLTLPNSSGGTILLFNGSTDLQTITYPPSLEDNVSWAFADGNWAATYTPTPGQPNIITTTEPCPDGQVRNTDTNRCITSATDATTATGQAACPAGQTRNPETNRCRSVSSSTTSTTPTPCKEGQERNPETNRCRAVATSSNTTQSCPTGQERNPDTNRCRKIAAAGSTSSSGLNGVKDVASDTKPAGKPYKLIIIAALGAVLAYGVYEWRQELRLGIAKLRNKLLQKSPQEAHRIKPITSMTTLR